MQRNKIYLLITSNSGVIHILFALTILPMILLSVLVVDTIRVTTAKNTMQSVLDNAVLDIANDLSDSRNQIKESDAKSKLNNAIMIKFPYGSYNIESFSINYAAREVSVTITSSVPISIAFLKEHKLNYRVSSASKSPTISMRYTDFYLMLDNSDSMLIAATLVDQNRLRQEILHSSESNNPGRRLGCEFACHLAEHGDIVLDSNGKSYANNYEIARDIGVTLRSDLLADAATKLVDHLLATDVNGEFYQVGLYYFNQDLVEKKTMTPISGESVNQIKTTILDPTHGVSAFNGLFSGSSGATYMDIVFPKIAETVGVAGTGLSVDNRKKVVFMVTDGVNDKRVIYDAVHPPLLSWCQAIKNTGAILAIVYTTYYPIIADVFYRGRLGINNDRRYPNFAEALVGKNKKLADIIGPFDVSIWGLNDASAAADVQTEVDKRIQRATADEFLGGGTSEYSEPFYGGPGDPNYFALYNFSPNGYNSALDNTSQVIDTVFPVLKRCGSPGLVVEANPDDPDGIFNALKDLFQKSATGSLHLTQ